MHSPHLVNFLFKTLENQEIPTEILNIFLKDGFDINTRANDGLDSTLLTKAATFNRKDTIKLLLQPPSIGADINAQDKNGSTALMLACNGRNENIAILLLEKGADTNIQNKNSYTALIYACMYGYENVIKLLLEKGADKTLKNKDDQTALDLARKYHHENCVTILEEPEEGTKRLLKTLKETIEKLVERL